MMTQSSQAVNTLPPCIAHVRDFFYFIPRKNKNGLIYAEFFCKKICKYMQVFYTFVNRNNQLHLL